MSNIKRVITAAIVTIAGAGMVVGGATAAEAKAKTFSNCTAMHKVYKHGVGRPHAHDKTSGTPVTNFKRDLALYNANKGSDRDGDGIACEA
jgi:hypothetical protein